MQEKAQTKFNQTLITTLVTQAEINDELSEQIITALVTQAKINDQLSEQIDELRNRIYRLENKRE